MYEYIYFYIYIHCRRYTVEDFVKTSKYFYEKICF